MNWDEWWHGKWTPKERVVCPHCHERGEVSVRLEDRKSGISGGKATAAILTLGLSLLVAGLSEKVEFQHAWCGNCLVSWDMS